MAGDEGFVSRWSRRKALAQQGQPLPPEPAPAPAPPPPATPAPAAAVVAEAAAPPAEAPPDPPPTLEDAQRLTPAADFTRFVRPDVEPAVRNTALKTLFSDPHFNVMDGLDVYIDDYHKPDPLPASWLRKMAQSQMLRLFEAEPAPAAEAPAITEPPAPAAAQAHEDPDLRLQPDDAAGCPGPEPGPGPHAGGEP